MPELNPQTYAYYDINDKQYYASNFWMKLLAILDPDQMQQYEQLYKGKVPLKVMVDYTQAKFLRKRDQRWALENHVDSSPEIKQRLDSLLSEYNQVREQPLPEKAHFALFLGTTTANLCKKAFYLFDAITKNNAKIETVLTLGNTEPYDKFVDAMYHVIKLHPGYFRQGLLPEDVPVQATMNELMLFILDNLNWPEGTKPKLVGLTQKHPCNTGAEANKVVNYLSEKLKAQAQCSKVIVLSLQPFNDRQGITVLGAFVKANLATQCNIEACGPGINTYPRLNEIRESTMSIAQLVDNISRTLYEIHQNADVLLMPKKNQIEEMKPKYGSFFNQDKVRTALNTETTKLHSGDVHLSFASMFSASKPDNEIRTNTVPHHSSL